MISLDVGNHRFHLRAAAVVAHDGFVLLHRLEGDTYWALPGGRVEPGEDARSTVAREMLEELNESVVAAELLYVVENFFELGYKPQHEIGLYFRAHFAPASEILNKSRTYAGVEGSKQLEFRWFPSEQLHAVDLRPSFLRESLALPTLGFRHVVQRG